MELPKNPTQLFKVEDQESKLLPNDTRVSKTSVVGDLIWDLEEQVDLPTASVSQKKLDFTWIIETLSINHVETERYLLPIREFFYARLFSPIRMYKPINPMTANNQMTIVKVFVYWCISQQIRCFSELNADDFNEFLQFLLVEKNDAGKKKYSSERIATILGTVQMFYDFREKMSEKIIVKPYSKASLTKLAGSRTNKENRTLVIPELIYFPYMRESHNYVMYYRSDIIETRRKINKIASRLARLSGEKSASTIGNIFRSRVGHLLKTTNISRHPETGRPWRKPWSRYSEFINDEVALESACIINTIGLSGMRISEYYSLLYGCVDDQRSDSDPFGRVYINGLVYKQKETPTEEKWVVNELIKQSISTLEMILAPLRTLAGNNHLCITAGRASPLFLDVDGFPSAEDYINAVREMSPSAFNNRLNRFAQYCADKFEDGEAMRTWSFNSRQFRRTLAHYIARKPFGIIAGKMQFKHVETYIFEGYAGRDPSFLDLLNKERSLASADILPEIIMDAADGELAGPRGSELLQNFRGVAGDKPNKGIEYYIKNKRIIIYPGMFSFCFFEPDSALCLKDNKKKEAPILNACRPDVCPNSCITTSHLPAWENQIHDAKSMLKHKNIPEHQKVILIKAIDEMEATIRPIKS